MSIDPAALNALFAKPAFAPMGERRLELFRQFTNDIQDKSPVAIVTRYMRLNSQLSKEKPLTKSEREAISEAIKESLSEEDRRKFNTVLKML